MLKPLSFTPFTTNELEASGWLLSQLKIQANSLSGNLDKIWPDVRDSKWIGGSCEGWERVPYWLDGFIPLAWLLNDDDMKSRATKYIDAIISGQCEDGWLCPCTLSERKTYDVWAFFLISKVLVLYYECTGDSRIEEVIYNGMKQMNRHIEGGTVFDWASTRWYECLIPLFWLYERKPEKWMEDLAYKLYAQGTDFDKIFDHWRFDKPCEKNRWSQLTHVVNMAMCLKSKALISRLTGEDPNKFAVKAINTLLADHGMPIEHFSGDECLSGTSPIQGSECCSVVEAMYSYEWLLAITGDPQWADRLEKLAFNALPATLTPDMWGHQYDQMTNQVQCARMTEEENQFKTNGPESHMFGLEPNFGCCTANFNQGWPKFALSTFMKSADGIVVTAISPSILNTKINGVDVNIEVVTKYPFEDGYKIIVTPSAPVEFNLQVRVPSNAKNTTINGKKAGVGFVSINKIWDEPQTVQIAFDFDIVMEKGAFDMYCVKRGALLFALPIKERWEKLEYTRDGVERKFPYCDYEIFPESKFNYAFADNDFTFNSHDFGEFIFSPETPPVSINANFVEIDWKLIGGKCTETPTSTTPLSEKLSLKLIPYGCTNLRMTLMPLIKGE